MHGKGEYVRQNLPIEIKTIQSNDPNYTVDNPKRRCPELTLIKNSVNYFPNVEFSEGLKRVYNWYKGNLK